MSWFPWLFTLWSPSALSLLLLSAMDRHTGLEVVQAIVCSRWGAPINKSLSQDGDVIIGGLFNLYYKSSAVEHGFTKLPHYEPCTGLDLESLKNAYTMTFAVEEINRNSTLLPGVKLGYRILDSCASSYWAQQVALSLVGGDAPSCNLTPSTPRSAAYGQPGETAAAGQPVPLLIGTASSTSTIVVSRVLGPLSVPLISYMASCPCLSDRLNFPNVFRTIPSDIYQAQAMARMAIRFRWTWIGAVIENKDYGHLAIQAFQEETRGKGVCFEFIETVLKETIVSDASRVALTIQASTARVILVFCWYTEIKEVFLELAKTNVTDRQFLASEAWSTSDDILQDLDISKVASGVVGVAIRRSSQKASLPLCSGTESLEGVKNPFTNVSQLRVAYNVYLAVYAAAHALHSLLSCPDRESSSRNNSSTCSSPKHIKPKELLQHLNKLNFTTPQGDMFYFQGADIPAKYDLVNWQETPEGSLKLVLIGRVDGFDLHLNESAIQWRTGSNQVPVSVCTESCPPGTRKANKKGEPLCCFDCIQCAEGEISNQTDSLHSRPGAGALMKWFGPGQQRGSVCLFTSIQIIICVTWLSLSPPVPQRDLGFQGSTVTLECAMGSVVGFSLVLGYIVWVAFVPAYISSPGKYTVAVEIFAILASSYGLLLCIFAPKCFIIFFRPEKNTKKHLMAR
ncbi:hypothetical protein VZT92_020842 [Zoarces viviparus]|uniref:G-protein coupled receptors family 3 profile domain-containing protein n=1 Tax=Zoarces viviparus TaxID=48416 RepID=A0AAW1EER7_ZOAVI